ncbi:MAG TPA: PAS domain S-box protein [Anaerolineales bacterium]|nr:PAS domain S-box protein [Anaerolineales bacterium]
MKTARKTKTELSSSKTTKSTRKATTKSTGFNGKQPPVTYEHAPIGIVESSLEGRYINVNEEFCRLLGYEKKELLRQGIKDFTHEDDYALDVRLHEQLVAGQIPFYRLEKRYVRKQGDEVWVELTRSLVRDAKGKPLYTVGVVLDISDRKDVERVLRESVERLRLATESARMFTWEWDFQKQLYRMDDNFEKVIGFSAGLLPQNQAETVFELSPAEDRQAITEAVQTAIERRSDLHSLQYRIIHPENGQVVWLEANGKVVFNEEGNAVRMFGVAQNITENKKAEESLQLARMQAEQSADRTARLQKVTAALSGALTPPQVAEVLASQGAPAFGAVSSSMMLLSEDRQTLELMHTTTSEVLVRPYQRFPVSLHVPAADAVRSGEIVWIESRRDYLERYPHLAEQIHLWGQQAGIAVPMVYEDRTLGALTMSFDRVLPYNLEDREYVLTLARQGAQALERARAGDALRESEERFRALVSQATAGITESDTNGVLTFVNPRLCEMLGYSEAELLGKTIWELTYSPDVEENRRLFERMLLHGESYQLEKRFVRGDGSTLWTSVSVSTIYDLSGKPKGGVGVILDINSRKEAEQVLTEFAREQAALYTFVDQLHRTASLEDIFNAGLDAILSGLQCDRASILLFDESDLMRFVAWRGLSDEYRNATEGHSPWTPEAVDPEPIAMNDLATADLSDSLRAIIQGEGIRSLAFIPLVSNNRLIGKFMIYFDTPHMFTEDQLDLSLTIARQLAFGVDRKRAEEKLRESEERYRAVVESQSEMLCRFRPDGTILFVNNAYARARGMTPEALSKHNFWDFIPEADRTSVKEMLDRLTPEASEVHIENRFQTTAGERWTLWTNRALKFDANGHVLEAQSSGIDITDRKRAEEALRESEERYRFIVENTSEGIWSIELTEPMPVHLPEEEQVEWYYRHAVIRQSNLELARMYGFASAKELVGLPLREVMPHEHPLNTEMLRDFIRSNYRLVDAESYERDAEGRELVFLNNMVGVVEDGKLLGEWGTNRNITERKRAEDALRESEERYRGIVNQSIAGIAETDLTGKYRMVNDRYCEITGYSRTELLSGMRMQDLTHPDDVQQNMEMFGRLSADGIPFEVEKRYICPDGSFVWVHNSVSAIAGADGKPQSAVAVVIDVTARKRTEEVLRVRARQQQAVARLGELAVRERDLQEVFDQATAMVADTLGVEYCKVLELLDGGDALLLRAGVGWKDGLLGRATVSTGLHSQAGYTLASEEPVVVSDLHTEQRFHGPPLLFDHGVVSGMSCIIHRADGNAWGVLGAHTTRPVDFTVDDVNFLVVMANILSDAIQRQQAEQALRASEQRFREIFETAGVSVWVQDFRQVKAVLDELRAQGVHDLHAYLEENPDFVRHAIGLVRIVDVNNETLELFGARDKSQLLESLDRIFLPETERAFRDELIALAEGREMMRAETTEQTLDGRRISVIFTIHFNPQLGDYSRVVVTLTDITERKRIEEALRLENERFMRFVDSNIVGILIGNASGKVIVANDYYLNLLGVSREEFSNQKVDWQKFTPREWLPADEKAIRELREHGISEPYEKEYVRADGTRVPVYIADAMLPGPGEEIAAFVLDITERKRAEETLRRNEELFSTLVEAAPFGVYFIDSEFRLRAVNKGSEAVFAGIYPLIGRDFAEILRLVWKEPFATEAIERFRHTLRTGESFISPPTIEPRANIDEIQSYDWQIHRITMPDGSYGVVCYFYDLSEQKKMEATVRASEALYRAIASNIPGGGVYVVDKDFRYLIAEGPVTEAFQLSREILEGRTVLEAFPDERGERMMERLRRNFAGETISFETQFDGRTFWTRMAPLSDSIGQVIILTLDITERKQAEEALRQSEERFALFMQYLPGLAWIKDIEGKYVYANAAAENAFSTSYEKLYGKTDWDIFPAEIAAQFKKNDDRALVEGKGVQVVETLQHADGVLHYSLVSKFPIPGPDGNPALIGGTALDITERLRAEEALRESEERFRAILRQATAGIVRKDAEGRLIFVNQAFCNMLGYTEADLLGKTMWDFMHEDDIAENQQSYNRLMMEGIPFNLERRLIREDGSLIWVDASVSPIMDSEGRPQSAVAVEVDITGRKRAEEALHQLNLQLEERVLSRTAKLRTVNQTLRDEIAERKRVEEALRQSEAIAHENEAKLLSLFDLLPVGISFLGPEGRVVQTNSALLSILKVTKEQFERDQYRSRKYVRADGTPMPASEFASARAIAQNRTVFNVETGIVLENGEVVWTSVSAAPVEVADVGVVVVTVDITENKRAERALQESHGRLRVLSQRLVEVQEDERRALARELHDRVGQTLAALNINLIIINSQLSPEVNEQIGTRLNDSMKLVAETIALVRDVMTDLRPAVLDDYGLEAALEAHVSQYISRYDIDVKFEKPEQPLPRLGSSVEMTFLRIAQEALMNIARHARAKQVDLLLRRDEHEICLKIQDNGIGIQSWQEANRPGSHGLTIMRERAEAFGGSLQVRSVPGQGTTVEATIPIKGQSPAQQEKS